MRTPLLEGDLVEGGAKTVSAATRDTSKLACAVRRTGAALAVAALSGVLLFSLMYVKSPSPTHKPPANSVGAAVVGRNAAPDDSDALGFARRANSSGVASAEAGQVVAASLWCERKNTHPYTPEYFTDLVSWLTKEHGAGGAAPSLKFDRLLLRLIDPGVFPDEYDFDDGAKPTVWGLLRSLKVSKWDGEVYALPYVVQDEPWKWGTDVGGPVGKAVEWVAGVNARATTDDILNISGIVYESQGDDYQDLFLFSQADLSRGFYGLDGTLPGVGRIALAITPQANAEQLLQTIPFDEGIVEMYNLVSGPITLSDDYSGGRCTCRGPSTECQKDATCSHACTIAREGGACQKSKPVSGVCAVDATVADALSGCEGIIPHNTKDKSAYLEAIYVSKTYPEAGPVLAEWFAQYITGNSAGLKPWPRDPRLSLMFSTECTGQRTCHCLLAHDSDPSPCGTIPAFGTWQDATGIDGFLSFVLALRELVLGGAASKHRIVIFDYNYLPLNWKQIGQ